MEIKEITQTNTNIESAITEVLRAIQGANRHTESEAIRILEGAYSILCEAQYYTVGRQLMLTETSFGKA